MKKIILMVVMVVSGVSLGWGWEWPWKKSSDVTKGGQSSTETVTEITQGTTEQVQVEEYVPKVIIEGKWGTGPGEFGIGGGEGDVLFPKSFVVDKEGNIYILDHFNNRIQKFNPDGKYITSIPVKSFENYSLEEIKKELKKNPREMPAPKLWVTEMDIDEDGYFYLPQRKGRSIKYHKIIRYDITGKEIEIKLEKFEKIRKKIKSKKEENERKINFHNKIITKLRENSSFGSHYGDYFIDGKGNIYQMYLIPHPEAPEYPAGSQGLRIIKWEKKK